MNKSVKIVDAACGFAHTLLLDNQGFVYGSGCNDKGQLGNGNTNSRYQFVKIDSLESVKQISTGGECGKHQ